MKYIRVFYLKIFIFGGKFFCIFELACFHNGLLRPSTEKTPFTPAVSRYNTFRWKVEGSEMRGLDRSVTDTWRQ